MTKSRISVVLAAAIAGSCIFISGCGKAHEDRSQAVFPQKLNSVAQLRRAKGENQKEKLRILQLAPDGITKSAAIIQYIDGTTALVHYRTQGPNTGTMSDAKLYFALPQETDQNPADKQDKPLVSLDTTIAGRKLARDMEFDVDGHTFTKDVQYDDQGNVTHVGRMTSPVLYDAFDFVAVESPTALKLDIVPGTLNRAVSKHQEYTLAIAGKRKTWSLGVEETFFPDGVHKSQGAIDDTDGSFTTTNFTHDRAVESKTIRNRYNTSFETDLFQADGKTLKQKLLQTTYAVTVENYDSKGVILERNAWAYNNRLMTLTYFQKGQEAFTQFWQRPVDSLTKPDDPIDRSKYALQKIQIKEAKTVREIDLADDQKTIKNEMIMAADANQGFWAAHTSKSFRDNGTLEQVQVYQAGGKLVSTKKYTAEQNVREPLNAKYVQMRQFEQPPKALPQQARQPFGFGRFF
ncbi:MAG TPA: hypothetical protein V6C81_18385 [Planktothrix sp.]|jgi:hypothetical protein